MFIVERTGNKWYAIIGKFHHQYVNCLTFKRCIFNYLLHYHDLFNYIGLVRYEWSHFQLNSIHGCISLLSLFKESLFNQHVFSY